MKLWPLLALLFLFLISCPTTPPPPEEEVLPDSRTFLMGFSPWPPDATVGAVNWAYTIAGSLGDIISHHMEEGVPWSEALADEPFPQGFQDEIQGRLDRRVPGQEVLLQISPLNMGRDGLALYRGDSPNQALPDPWSGRDFASAEVRTAFLNYARQMIDYFEPDRVLLGVEVNLLATNAPELWDDYVVLQAQVYQSLKTEYPELPLGLSVVATAYFPDLSPEHNLEVQLGALEDLDPYTDFLSFSVHPFMSALLANTFPEDYFDSLFALTDKPISISESSYPSQVWSTAEGLQFNGSQEKSRQFLRIMLDSLNRHQGEFLIWFSAGDYDALWSGALAEDPLALIWRDTGLYDEEGQPRLAQRTWQSWFEVPYSP